MIPLRLVIDTNIVASAALEPDGPQRTVLVVATYKPASLYISEAVLAEYQEVLARPGAKDPQGPSAATPATHQKPITHGNAIARPAGDQGPG